MSSTNLNTSCDSNENACVVCFKFVDIYSIGDCDHPVCYECSTRMRVLLRQNECPICRHDMAKVIFTKDPLPFKQLLSQSNLFDRKFRICFCGPELQSAFNDLLEHHCPRCPVNEPPGGYRTFNAMKEHLRREHELHYCDLCIENLKIFTFERRCYTRQELAQHRRKGDTDDKSHKGHPLCEFCDRRYMDSDELFRHMRRDHLFCHFCDADGYHHYYISYDCLRQHFQAEHYLCEEGECMDEQFTSVFRSEIDLKAHRASVHSRSLGKAATKQARTLELEFTLAPRTNRPEQNNRGGGMGGDRGGSRRPQQGNRNNVPREDRSEEGAVGYDSGPIDPGPSKAVTFTQPTVDPMSAQDFPSLGGGPMRPGQFNIRHSKAPAGSGAALARTKENFPALGPPSEPPPTQGAHVRLSLNTNSNSSSQNGPSSAVIKTAPSNAPNLSIHVSKRPNGVTITSNKTPANRGPGTSASRPQSMVDDFPSLGGPAIDMSGVSSKHRSLVADTYTSVGMPSGPKVSLVKQDTQSSTRMRQEEYRMKGSAGASDFPALSGSSSGGAVANNPQWLSPKPKKQVKIAPTPVIQPKNFNDTSAFPTLNNNNNNNKAPKKKSTSVTLPVSGGSSWADVDKTSKNKKKKKIGSNNSSGNESSKKENIENGQNQNLISDTRSGTWDQPDNSKIKKERKVTSAKQNGSVERMRSELNISPLQDSSLDSNANASTKQDATKSDSLGNLEQDFPSLGISVPPGFGPPPGFAGAQPPPGFSVTLNSVARPHSNGLTFISSSGQSYSIRPGDGLHMYNPPQDFARRNKHLVAQFQLSLSAPEALHEFRRVSHLYREGQCPASDYYDHCKTALAEEFTTIFPELLTLLPDISKQQELYLVHSQRGGTAVGPRIDVCATCKQVVLAVDLKSHVQSHSLENQFPALSNEVSTGGGSAWKK